MDDEALSGRSIHFDDEMGFCRHNARDRAREVQANVEEELTSPIGDPGVRRITQQTCAALPE